MPGGDFSQTRLCNRALAFVGVTKRIAAITEKSVEAQFLREQYDSVLEAAYRRWPWKFATARDICALNATAPVHTRSYSFALPTACLYLLPPDPEADFTARDWQVEGRNIITNFEDPPNVRFIQLIEDPNAMNSDFREAFSAELGYSVAPGLTNSNSRIQWIRTEADRLWLLAQESDGAEGPPKDLQPDEQDSWLESMR